MRSLIYRPRIAEVGIEVLYCIAGADIVEGV
jgi:hypothetical protein